MRNRRTFLLFENLVIQPKNPFVFTLNKGIFHFKLMEIKNEW